MLQIERRLSAVASNVFSMMSHAGGTAGSRVENDTVPDMSCPRSMYVTFERSIKTSLHVSGVKEVVVICASGGVGRWRNDFLNLAYRRPFYVPIHLHCHAAAHSRLTLPRNNMRLDR